jgi:hypothetical protein
VQAARRMVKANQADTTVVMQDLAADHGDEF